MNDLVILPRDEFEALLEQSAERGAQRALAKVGLHDEDAGDDVRDLRRLMDSFRTVKRGALGALGKWIMVAVLAGLALLAGRHFNVGG